VRRIRFWPAALISSLLFAAAHADAYLLWPRAIALAGTGVVLAWLYRWRGYWASVTAHATVNVVAATALVASS
jgi:membrane protease YdiL (CAAX protease family)